MEMARTASLITIPGLFGITFLSLAIKIVRQYERGVTEIAGEKNSTIIPIPLDIANTLHAISQRAGAPGLLKSE